MKGATGQGQPKKAVPDSTFPLRLSPCKNLRYLLTPSRDVVDQRDLHSDWLTAFLLEKQRTRGLEYQIFPRSVVFEEW